MTQYVNAGALVDGENPRTKATLRNAMKASPEHVQLYGTGMFGPQYRGVRGDEIPEDVVFTVTGPDPYHERRWYAKVRPDRKVE